MQTPHVFLNRDPIERNLRTFDHMPSENEMFYSVTQRGLDKWNGSFFCGSAALLRRSALETTNGFSGLTVTEDCETAFELHRAGWTSVYVDKPLTAGLQPETFESFIGQRSRWCQGMFQLLLLKNPALKPGLTPIQRLAYLSSMTFWFFPLPRLVFMFAPLLHIFFDVKLFVSTVEESIAYAATYVVVNTMIQNELFGHVRWPWMSELYEYVQGVYLVKAIGSVIASPRKPTFNVTAKGVSLDIRSSVGAGVAVHRDFRRPAARGRHRRLAICIRARRDQCDARRRAMGAFQSVDRRGGPRGGRREARASPASPPRGVASQQRLLRRLQRRRHDRERVGRRVCDPDRCGGLYRAASMQVDKSRGRLAILGADGHVVMRTLDVIRTRAEWDGETVILGLKFALLEPADYLVLADLIYGDADALMKFLTKRRKHMGILRGTMLFLRWSACEPFRAFHYLFARCKQAMAARCRGPPRRSRNLSARIGSPRRSHRRASRSCRGGFRSAARGGAVDFSGSVADRSRRDDQSPQGCGGSLDAEL